MKRELSLGEELTNAYQTSWRSRKQARTRLAEVLMPRIQPGDDKENIERAIAFIE
jgi:hypothetical protein